MVPNLTKNCFVYMSSLIALMSERHSDLLMYALASCHLDASLLETLSKRWVIIWA